MRKRRHVTPLSLILEPLELDPPPSHSLSPAPLVSCPHIRSPAKFPELAFNKRAPKLYMAHFTLACLHRLKNGTVWIKREIPFTKSYLIFLLHFIIRGMRRKI